MRGGCPSCNSSNSEQTTCIKFTMALLMNLLPEYKDDAALFRVRCLKQGIR